MGRDPDDLNIIETGLDVQALMRAMGSIYAKSLTHNGRDNLVDWSGDIAAAALALSLVVNRLKEHAKVPHAA